MRASLVVFFLAAAVLAQAPAPVPIFDGTTLAGWRGEPAVWSVQDGCIVGSTKQAPIQANTFLVLDGNEPANFVFTAKVRLDGDNNSGVQYRSRLLPGGGFRAAGYQCDVHAANNYMAQLYDEQGAGIVAERGQFVRWRDDGRKALGAIASPKPFVLAEWHTLRIVAMGELCWHELDGVPCTAVLDERADAPRAGVLALQVHAGPPMAVFWKDLALQHWHDAAAMQKDVPVPAAIAALRKAAAAAAARPVGEVPKWIWNAKPSDGQELFFRRAFTIAGAPSDAQLVIACDNHFRVYLDGEKVGEGNEWEAPLHADVTKHLRAGDHVIAVHGWNDGGPAALAVHLSWQESGAAKDLVSDASWSCCSDDPDGWNTVGFTGKVFQPVTVLGALGDSKLPWTHVHGADAFGVAGDPFTPQLATIATEVAFVDAKTAPEAPVLRLLQVPRSLGSWVSLGIDAKGRLYAGAEGGGLYRVTPANGLAEESRIERVPVTIGGAHGLLWFRDALYAVVNGRDSGLYRLTDTNGDDVLDRVELLQKLEGEGEHGPHSVVVAPDGKHLLVVCGNQTKLPQLASSRVPTNWAEDRLLPRLEDPHKYWEGISPPGGWVCQCDADGKNWELICCGFRNPFDIVVLPTGEVVVYDADMEWDMGLPWYRPTRLLGVHSGVDYGWRIGSAKWPADYPEAPRAIADLGPGSPTGMAVMKQFKGFVVRTIALDWTFGIAYANGTPWLAGAPLPLCDVAVVDGATYLVTGGRGLPSTLLRVPEGNDQREPTTVWYIDNLDDPDMPLPATALIGSWQDLSHAAALAYFGTRTRQLVVARAALECQPVAGWRAQALEVDPAAPRLALQGLLALARQGTAAELQPVLDAIGKLPFAPLAHLDRIAWLRVHALALLRLGPANDSQRAAIAQRLLPLFPTGNEREDQDLAELLAYVDAPGVLDKLVPALTPMRPSPVPAWANTAKRGDVYGDQYGGVIRAMVENMPPIGQLAIADALRTVRHGWTLEQRRTYFVFLGEARKRKGGSSYDGFVKKMIDAAWATCSPAEQRELAELVGVAKADAPKFVATPPKGPGKDWQLGDIDAVLRDGLAGGDVARGRNLFHAASCASCHYFAGEGGNHGPDLTSLGNKFTARDVLESILAPSKVVSDQYAGQVLTKKDGKTLFGFAVKGHDGDVEVWEVMPAAADAQVVKVPVADVAKVERSPLSPMPTNLVDRLSAAELRDLLVFLLSRGRTPGK
jgi:putative heme-binding domain-containing protein